MNLREIPALIAIIAQLVSMFGGKKAKRKAQTLFPAVLELTGLWPGVRLALDQLAQTDPQVRRFRELVDQSIGELRTI